MRVAINFDKYINPQTEFWNILLEVAKKSGGKPRYIGSGGISVSNLSWQEAFRLGCKLVYVCQKFGLHDVDSIRLHIQDDIRESDPPDVWIEKLKEKKATQAS